MHATTSLVAASAVVVAALCLTRPPVLLAAAAPPYQGPTAPAPKDSNSLASTAGLSGQMSFPDGKPIPRAVVTATPTDARITVRRVDTTDPSGFFRIDSLPKGEYLVVIRTRGGETVSRRLRVDSAVTRDIVLPLTPPEDTPTLIEIGLTTLFAFLYCITIAFVRWHNIARSVNELLQRQLLALELRVNTEVGTRDSPQLRSLRQTLTALCAEEKRQIGKFRVIDFLVWSRGHENAVWSQLHEIERALAAFLAPPEQVEAYLRSTQGELRRLSSPTALALADAIGDSLKTIPPTDTGQREHFESSRQALLGRALSVLFVDRDDKFSSLMEWQNKAGWLISAALLIVIFLTVAAGHAVLFLAGAAGGFLSRLERTLKREDLPLDYGASWTTLFLSPVLGALMGWFGVALISLLTDDRVNLLGSAFRLVDWTHPRSPWTLGVAFGLGFSERLFDSIVSVLENHTEQSQARTASVAAQAAAITAATTPPPATTTTASAPTISAASLELRASGASRDALIITGDGFAPNAKIMVNGTERAASVDLPQRMTLPLSADDLQRIHMGGDFDVVVRNASGAASAPFAFAAVVTP